MSSVIFFLSQSNHIQQVIDTLTSNSTLQSKEFAVVIQRLSGIEVTIKIGFFREKADVLLDDDVGGWFSKDTDSAAGFVKQS